MQWWHGVPQCTALTDLAPHGSKLVIHAKIHRLPYIFQTYISMHFQLGYAASQTKLLSRLKLGPGQCPTEVLIQLEEEESN